jgi:dihydroorotate dehydrogenase
LIYRVLFRLVLQRIDPERAHALAFRVLRGTAPLVRRLARSPDARLQVRALGMTFPSPLGVAAGLDKNAECFRELGALGFGFVEVGTVTALAQGGNPRPRIARLTRDRALLNRMGFPNDGARTVAGRLPPRPGKPIIGVNVGKSRAAPADGIRDDYRASVREVAPACDYLVVNVSSPNTPGLRDMQSVELLRPLLEDVRSELRAGGKEIPLLVKIAPDLQDDEVDAIAGLALELELDGIVAVNTTATEGGGLSGPPLAGRAVAVLRRLRARVGDRMVLISVGGIESPGDAWERILAGATLVQAYTAFVYRGPAWPRHMNRELARRVRETGRSSVQELVGVGGGAADPGESELSLTAVRSPRA